MITPSKINRLLEALRIRPVTVKDFERLGYAGEQNIRIAIHRLREQGHIVESFSLDGLTYYTLREVAGVFRERDRVVKYLADNGLERHAVAIREGKHWS